MSRIGRTPIAIPAGVEIKIDGSNVEVKGKMGTLSKTLNNGITAKVEDGHIVIERRDDSKQQRAYHGLNRTLVANMVTGVTEGYSKTLEVNGVGYRAAKEGTKLVLNIGYSHQVMVDETDTIKIDVPNPNTIVIKGIDKQEVGQFAADVRNKRRPEPYKGKGIKYANEVIRRKEGKTGK